MRSRPRKKPKTRPPQVGVRLPRRISRRDASDAHEAVFEMALRVLDGKRRDYSGDDDPFANFRRSLRYGVQPSLGAQIRWSDKESRLEQLIAHGGQGHVKDESIWDTMADQLNYQIIINMLKLEEAGLGHLVAKRARKFRQEKGRTK